MSEHAYVTRAGAHRAPSRSRRGGEGRPGAAGALGVAGLCVAALAATWSVSALVPGARLRDAIVLHDFMLLNRPHVETVGNALLAVLDPAPFTLLAIVLVVFALLRRRPAVALAIAAVMGLAPLTSELLKPLLAHAHDQVAATHIVEASWPSGHATAAAALVLCAVLASPVRLRPVVGAVGLAFAAGVGCSLLILAWHMPSDVIGGYLVGALWMALAVAALRARAAGRSRPRVSMTARL
jgi:membrane-associated phospholipid phosphatase